MTPATTAPAAPITATSPFAVPASIARAYRLMDLRNAAIQHIERIRLTTGRPMRKVRRLNLESATRRSLVGAKGLR